MSLLISTFIDGSYANNVYLLADSVTRQAVIIDPSFSPQPALNEAAQKGWQINAVWLTHAHFDHIAGVAMVCAAFQPPLPVGLHPDDLALYQRGGEAKLFGVAISAGPMPSLLFQANQTLQIGQETIHLLQTPGHTPGHVVFYSASAGAAVCGDLIFRGSVGRTDTPGGDSDQLLASIRTHIMPLPPTTRLLSGHGPETTVGEEIRNNPFLI